MRLNGLIAAPSTPMDKKGGINTDVIPEYADWLRKSGVSGVFVNGTTGESLSLSPQERMELVTAWSRVCGDGLKLIVHVGDNSLPVSKELAVQAREAGAAAVGAMPPSFLRPSNAGSLAEWCAEVASAVPGLPFYYYHIPSMTGVFVRMADLFPLVSSIPSFAGVKFTYEDMMDYQMAVDYEGGRFDVLFGRDEMLLSGLVCGARAAVGSTYNYMAPVYLNLIRAYDSGDMVMARKWQARSHSLVRVLQHSSNGIACGKAVLCLRGVDVGPCRSPLPAFSSGEVEKLRRELESIGFFEWCDGVDPQSGR